MTFNDLCNQVCRDIPEGWDIAIELELDAGIVALTDPDGTQHEFPSNYESIEQQVLDALKYANHQPQET